MYHANPINTGMPSRINPPQQPGPSPSGPLQQRMPNPQQQQKQPPPAGADLGLEIRQLIANLKEVLNKLIAAATRNFYANACVDNLEKGKAKDSDLFRFDKSFEQFHAICNQIERAVCLASHQIHQMVQSYQNISMNKSNEFPSHNDYIAIAKLQIQTSKEINDMLYDLLSKLK